MTVYVTHIHIPCHFRPKCCSGAKQQSPSYIVYKINLEACARGSKQKRHDSPPPTLHPHAYCRAKGLTRTRSFLPFPLDASSHLIYFRTVAFIQLSTHWTGCFCEKNSAWCLKTKEKRVAASCVTMMLLDAVKWYTLDVSDAIHSWKGRVLFSGMKSLFLQSIYHYAFMRINKKKNNLKEKNYRSIYQVQLSLWIFLVIFLLNNFEITLKLVTQFELSTDMYAIMQNIWDSSWIQFCLYSKV